MYVVILDGDRWVPAPQCYHRSSKLETYHIRQISTLLFTAERDCLASMNCKWHHCSAVWACSCAFPRLRLRYTMNTTECSTVLHCSRYEHIQMEAENSVTIKPPINSVAANGTIWNRQGTENKSFTKIVFSVGIPNLTNRWFSLICLKS
jgi:hypothetical protein